MNLYNVCMTDAQALPEDLQAARALIATLQAQAKTQAALLESKDNELSVKTNEQTKKSKYWFPQDLSFFQISRNCKYFKFCFPHFLFDIPSLCQTKISKYRFPQELSIFLISRNCKGGN